MRKSFALLLIVSSFAACGKDVVTWTDPDLGPQTAPAEVVRQADALLAALPATEQPLARRLYMYQFLRGFMLPDLHQEFAANAAPHFVQSFLAGQDYRRKHAGRLDAAMRGFGYEPKTVEGEFAVGFEWCCLRFAGQPGHSWWVEYMADIRLPWPKEEDPGMGLGRSMQVRATGYLSPPGGYGHLNQYERQFLATQMEPLPK